MARCLITMRQLELAHLLDQRDLPALLRAHPLGSGCNNYVLEITAAESLKNVLISSILLSEITVT